MTYHCIVCREKIAPARVQNALSRGQAPLYDKDRCSNIARQRAFQAKKRERAAAE